MKNGLYRKEILAGNNSDGNKHLWREDIFGGNNFMVFIILILQKLETKIN